MTGHSYIVYGPLSNGATVVMYEGAPDYPDKDRFWAIIEKYGVTILYTAPTLDPHLHALGRPVSRAGTTSPACACWARSASRSTPRRGCGTTSNIGGERCPIVDTWWQTETGMIMITPLPGIVPTKPGSATRPFPGVEADIVDEAGQTRCQPTPAATWSSSGPGRRCCARSGAIPTATSATYWSKYPGVYFTGDGARRDEDGYFWLLGRVDDVLNVSGHRLGTMEIESALVSHPAVAEAAVIGASGPDHGPGHRRLRDARALATSPTTRSPPSCASTWCADRRAGATEEDLLPQELPKTRSAKIMRRLLRDIAEGRALGDTTTLLDPNVVAQIKAQYESSEG